MLCESEIRSVIRDCNLSTRPVCIHSSFRSFGPVEGGPMAVVRAFLAEGCTVMVPTFSWSFLVPPPGENYRQNGLYAQTPILDDWPLMPGYSPQCQVLDEHKMGAIPCSILKSPERIRSIHPLCSFSAVGPLAHELLEGQAYLDVYDPFERLRRHEGFVILMGVGYDKCTLLHNAEKASGVRLTRRWAKVAPNEVVETENGSCSSGFTKLEEVLAPIANCGWVGMSYWRILPVYETMVLATQAMRHDILIRHCGHPNCRNCNDVSKGGPLLS